MAVLDGKPYVSGTSAQLELFEWDPDRSARFDALQKGGPTRRPRRPALSRQSNPPEASRLSPQPPEGSAARHHPDPRARTGPGLRRQSPRAEQPTPRGRGSPYRRPLVTVEPSRSSRRLPGVGTFCRHMPQPGRAGRRQSRRTLRSWRIPEADRGWDRRPLPAVRAEDTPRGHKRCSCPTRGRGWDHMLQRPEGRAAHRVGRHKAPGLRGQHRQVRLPRPLTRTPPGRRPGVLL